jgi:hypothetical protein
MGPIQETKHRKLNTRQTTSYFSITLGTVIPQLTEQKQER